MNAVAAGVAAIAGLASTIVGELTIRAIVGSGFLKVKVHVVWAVTRTANDIVILMVRIASAPKWWRIGEDRANEEK